MSKDSSDRYHHQKKIKERFQKKARARYQDLSKEEKLKATVWLRTSERMVANNSLGD